MKRDQAMILMLAGLASGCKSTSDFGMNEARQDKTRAAIKKAVESPERRNKMLAVVDALQREIKTIEENALSQRSQIIEANRDYATPRNDLKKIYGQLGELTRQFGDVAKERSMALRKLCTESEWKHIAAHKTEAVQFTF